MNTIGNPNPYFQQYLQTLATLAGQPPAQAAMPVSPPIVHSDFTVVDSIDTVKQTPVGIGQTMGFVLKDESVIIHKTGTQNGAMYEYWDKRPPEQEEDKYVTKENLKEIIAELIGKEKQADVVS